MEYGNLPVAKRTRSHMIARPCEKRKKAKLDGEGDLKVKKGRNFVKKNCDDEDEDEDEEVKVVCELVRDGSTFKVKGEGFDGEFVLTSKNVDVLKFVEQLGSCIRDIKGGMCDTDLVLGSSVDDNDDLEMFETRSFEEGVGKGRRKQVECVDVGKTNVGELKQKVVAAEKHSSVSSELEELESSTSEEVDDESNSDAYAPDDDSSNCETDCSDDSSGYTDEEGVIEVEKNDDENKDVSGRNITNKEINGKKQEGEKGKTEAARVMSGAKERRVSELDILVESNKKNAEKPQTVATRLRSRAVAKPENEKLNSIKASHSLPQAKDNGFSSTTIGDLEGSAVCKDGLRHKGKSGKPGGRKKSRGGKTFDPLKILIDSIWKEGESPQDKFSASEENYHAKEEIIYKFSLANQNVELQHKSEWDEEIDFLFNEMQKYLTCEEIGTSSLIDNEHTVGPAETTPLALCSRGHHQLRLDEQVGLICACCSYVDLEIKYIMPSFGKYPFGRPRNYFYATEEEFYSDIQFQDSAAEGLYDFEGSNHTEGTVWDLIPGTRRSMYEHQREGFEFIWKNVVGGICIENLENPLSSGGGGGCIISHAPGTGKTRLSIVFLQSFIKMYPKSRPVIVAPKSMLLTWEEEFKKWKVDVPFHNMNNIELSGKENAAAVGLLKINRQAVKFEKATRIIKLNSWSKGGSVLGISYRLFEQLAGGREKPREEKSVGNALLQLSSLVVLDEGHTPRNEQTLIWKALHKVETKRRIILSGTPFQNNFSELYNTLCLVKPNFADQFSGHNSSLNRDHKEIRKASKSKWASMTNSICDSTRKLNELKDKIYPFVHIHKGTILQEKLPGLRDALILLRPTEMQKSLFSPLQDEEDGMSYLDFSRLVTLVSVHPSLLLLPDSAKMQSCVDSTELSAHAAKLETLKMDPYAGVKTKFVIELARLCETWDEKVLVFSQYLSPLAIIKNQLEAYFRWNEGKEILYMDGSLDVKLRQTLIASLNDPSSNVRVLLASTKACSEGISLVGASRVVLLDVVWNPSVERQAISRAYRLGQRKMVYIYHLIAGKIEVERYERQIEKDRLSEMVFSSKSIDGCKGKISSAVTEDSVLEAMVQCDDKLGNMFQKIVYQPKFSDLVETYDVVDNI